MPAKTKKPTKKQLIERILSDDENALCNMMSNGDNAFSWLSALLKDGFVGYKHMTKAELMQEADDRGLLEELCLQRNQARK